MSWFELGAVAKLRWWWIFAVIVFLAGSWLLSPLNTRATCRDGTSSSAIGTQGACSWHGGVKSGMPWGMLLAGVVTGAIAFAIAPKPANIPASPAGTGQTSLPLVQPLQAEETHSDRDDPTRCPDCGARMVPRIARRGRRSGQAFWGCSKFPRCHGSRPATHKSRAKSDNS